MFRMKTLFLASLAAFASIGCTGGGKKQSVANLPEDKKISDLTPEEKVEFCVHVAEKVLDGMLSKNACMMSGVFAKQLAEKFDPQGDSTAECKERVDECLAEQGEAKSEDLRAECEEDNLAKDSGGEEDTSSEGEDQENEDGNYENCDVTVSELDSCLDAVLELMNDFYGQLDCEMTLAEMEEIEAKHETNGAALPEQCQEVQEKCPDMIGLEDEEETRSQ